MSVEGVLQGAIDEIEKNGWTQGTSREKTGEVCVSHALGRAARSQGMGQLWWPAVRSFEAVVGGDMILFNDRESTSKEDVILALKQAINPMELS